MASLVQESHLLLRRVIAKAAEHPAGGALTPFSWQDAGSSSNPDNTVSALNLKVKPKLRALSMARAGPRTFSGQHNPVLPREGGGCLTLGVSAVILGTHKGVVTRSDKADRDMEGAEEAEEKSGHRHANDFT